jgi:hypothetical protein
LDASQPRLRYWTCQSLDFLDALNTNEITKTIAKFQSPTTGGFGDDPQTNLNTSPLPLDAMGRPDGTVQRWQN